jgi:hypothetical protein
VPDRRGGAAKAVRDVRAFSRYARALPPFLRATVSPAEARRRVAVQLRDRETSFLDVLRRGVYDRPSSPYRPLLAAAGAELGDVRGLVRESGVEGALASLYAEGVRVSLDEFKGRVPIERPGISIPAGAEQFANPLSARHLTGSSSGSSGTPTRIAVDLRMLEHETAYRALFLDSFGLRGRPYGLWRVVPPSASGLGNAYRHVKAGEPVARWFNPYRRRRDLEDLQFGVFTAFSVAAGRALRVGMRAPEYCPPSDPLPIARWLAGVRAEGRPGILDTQVALGVRVCLAARAEGLDISGTFMRFGGEPYTPARAEVVREAGVEAACHYTMAETGRVGKACPDGAELDDVHFLSDKLAVIPGEGPGPVPLTYTSLLPSSATLMLNVESGDVATLEERDCGCVFGELGMRLHMHGVHGAGKLTSEGNHFLAGDLERLVEHVLPSRFGGAPTDYQVVEEDAGGLPKVSIVVREALGPIEPAEILDAALGYLNSTPRNRLMAGVWEQSDTLRVVRRDPHSTLTGKIPSVHSDVGG